MVNNNIFLELAKFNNIKFYAEPHVYFIDDEQAISVTGFVGGFSSEFEEEYHLRRKSIENLKKMMSPDDMTPEVIDAAMKELKKEWVFKNKHGRYEGTVTHSYLEGLLANKEIAENKDANYEGLNFDDISDSYYMLKNLARMFYDEYVVTKKLVPVRTELVVGNKRIGIAGQLDVLFYNTEKDCFQIYDWKTSRKIDRSSKWCMKHCLSHLESCDYTKYSLQVSAYRYIIERTTNIRVSNEAFIVWFNELNPRPEIIPAIDYINEVEQMVKFKMEHPELFPINNYERPVPPSPKIKTAIAMDDLLSF